MKDLLSLAHVVVNMSNLKISCHRLAHCVREIYLNACCTCVRLYTRIQPIISLGSFSTDYGNAKEYVV